MLPHRSAGPNSVESRYGSGPLGRSARFTYILAKRALAEYRQSAWRFITRLRWEELPSLGYPLYVLCGVLFFMLSSVVDLWYGQFFLVPLSLTLLILPALGLALNTVRLARQPTLALQLFLLYFMYGLARAYAVVKP